MPPKKKKGKKKKKKGKDDGELTVDDKYKRTLNEIEALKDHLAVRKEVARRSQAYSEEWRGRMKDAEEQLQETSDAHREVSADMTRQYKTMQTEMDLRIQRLENDLHRTQTQLEHTEKELKEEKEEKARIQKEKDLEIENLRLKIDSLGEQYERELCTALDNLSDKLKLAQDAWIDNSTRIQTRNKQTLLEFGLNPLDI